MVIVFAIAAVIVSSFASANPMGPRAIFEALANGTRAMVMTAILLCAVGLVVNVITTSGIGNTFSLMIATWSGGNILLAILYVALASLVLGMGLPVTADTRTGDTSQKMRRLQAKDPAEILVTTPESLYLILGAKARETLRTVDTVIVELVIVYLVIV